GPKQWFSHLPPSVGDKGSFLCHVDRPRNASTGPVEGVSDQARALRTASRTAGTTSAAKISTCCADSPAGPMTNVSIPYSTANSVICSTHLSTGPSKGLSEEPCVSPMVPHRL